MTCNDCPDQEELDALLTTVMWNCPHCNWTTEKDSCNMCINKHLRDKHGIEVDVTPDQETLDMLKWYGKKYGKEFKTVSELDTYILLHNLDNGKD